MKRKYILGALCLTLSLFICQVGQAQEENTDADAMYATELIKSGEIAPNMIAKDTDGKTFQLNKLRGHYVVIDFWASWCPDCRRDIPNVKRMYDEFHPKGVEFVGVSFDEKAENWTNAIAKYELNYTHVSELTKMRDSKIAKDYGIKWIPSMYIIDPQGKVVLSTVMSEKVEKKLKEIFPSQNVSKD